MFGQIMAFALGGWGKIIGIGVVIALGWFYVSDYQARGAKIATYRAEAKQYEAVIATLRKNAAQAQDAVKAAADARQAFKVNTEKMCAEWDKVRDSDTPVEDLLEALKKRDEARDAKPK